MELQENPVHYESRSYMRTEGRTDGQNNRRMDGRTDTTRLAVASDSFVNAPHKIKEDWLRKHLQ
jgi:hypothetical protein